jgi:hypothetical protein
MRDETYADGQNPWVRSRSQKAKHPPYSRHSVSAHNEEVGDFSLFQNDIYSQTGLEDYRRASFIYSIYRRSMLAYVQELAQLA